MMQPTGKNKRKPEKSGFFCEESPIKNYFNKTKTMQNFKIRKGEQSDLLWIAKLLKTGVDEGHFSKLLKNNSAGLINAIINNQKIDFVGMRGRVDNTQVYNFSLLVLEGQNTPVSFLVLKSGIDGIELHLAGTLKTHRRKGCFKTLANYVIQNNTQSSRFYARCYKKLNRPD